MNTVVECIVRCTPLVINRLPALEEYLGEDYPLFYEGYSLEKVTRKRIRQGHEYLKRLDKSKLRIETFISRFEDLLRTTITKQTRFEVQSHIWRSPVYSLPEDILDVVAEFVDTVASLESLKDHVSPKIYSRCLRKLRRLQVLRMERTERLWHGSGF